MKEYELSDGSSAWGIELPIPPYDRAEILCNESNAAEVLQEVSAAWPELWPEMLRELQDCMENLDIDLDLQDEEFVITACRTEPGKFMSDESDIMLLFNLSEPEGPEWHYFIRGSTIVHFQPTF